MFRKLASAIRDQWIGTLALFLFAISGTAYAANTVFSGDIVDGEVKTADLANAAVTNAKLADNSVGKPKISAGAVENGKIADGAVGTSKLGAGAATNAKIADGAVNSQKVQNQTLTTDDLGPGSVDNNEIEFDAVTGAEVADGTLGRADLAGSVVTPVAVGAFAGTCASETNCPLVFNRGVTSITNPGDGHYCIGAGGNGSVITAEAWDVVFADPVSVRGEEIDDSLLCDEGEFLVVTYKHGVPGFANGVGFSFEVY